MSDEMVACRRKTDGQLEAGTPDDTTKAKQIRHPKPGCDRYWVASQSECLGVQEQGYPRRATFYCLQISASA